MAICTATTSLYGLDGCNLVKSSASNDLANCKSDVLMFTSSCVNSLSNMCSWLNETVHSFVEIFKRIYFDR